MHNILLYCRNNKSCNRYVVATFLFLVGQQCFAKTQNYRGNMHHFILHLIRECQMSHATSKKQATNFA